MEASRAFWEHNTGTIARVLGSGDAEPLADELIQPGGTAGNALQIDALKAEEPCRRQ